MGYHLEFKREASLKENYKCPLEPISLSVKLES